jgi:hypothetical protein
MTNPEPLSDRAIELRLRKLAAGMNVSAYDLLRAACGLTGSPIPLATHHSFTAFLGESLVPVRETDPKVSADIPRPRRESDDVITRTPDARAQ